MVKRLLIAAVVAIVMVVGAAIVYVQFIKSDAPAPLTFTDDDPAPEASTDTTGGPPPDVDGAWVVGDGTEVGYRVTESFGGALESEAAGRTTEVTGDLTIDGTTVPEASFTADLTAVGSDDPGRDRQFHGRIMDTEQFPEATFVLTAPIDFGAVPDVGVALTAQATGDLTLHGVTNEVTFEVQAKIVGDHLEVLGQIPIVFADYEIPNPSTPVVTTHEDGTLEVLLVLTPSP